MTSATVGAEVAAVWFVFSVAVNTISRQAGICRNWIFMAGGTDQTLVGALKRETGLLQVVKLSVLPTVGVVAARAVFAKQLLMRLIFQVTVAAAADPLARRGLAVAAFAVELVMDADQWKAG